MPSAVVRSTRFFTFRSDRCRWLRCALQNSLSDSWKLRSKSESFFATCSLRQARTRLREGGRARVRQVTMNPPRLRERESRAERGGEQVVGWRRNVITPKRERDHRTQLPTCRQTDTGEELD